MTTPEKILPRTYKELTDRMAAGQHIGVQLYVSLNAEPVVDFGLGESRPGVKMTSDTLMAWFSSTKAVMLVAITQLWERGKLEIDAPACQYIPEFGKNGKEIITLRHLLTHTAGILWVDGVGPSGIASLVQLQRFKSWAEFMNKIYEARRSIYDQDIARYYDLLLRRSGLDEASTKSPPSGDTQGQ